MTWALTGIDHRRGKLKPSQSKRFYVEPGLSQSLATFRLLEWNKYLLLVFFTSGNLPVSNDIREFWIVLPVDGRVTNWIVFFLPLLRRQGSKLTVPKTNVWTQKNNRLSLISSSRNLSNILFDPVSRQGTVIDWFVFSLIYIKFASKTWK